MLRSAAENVTRALLEIDPNPLNLMTIYALNPLTDPRWGSFLLSHPDASIFHTKEWLQVLEKTYDYKPIAFSTSGQSVLRNAVVFCEVKSFITGKRLVSLPFSDHCQPLASGKDLIEILSHLQKISKQKKFKYIEIRPRHLEKCSNPISPTFFSSEKFCLQKIDLNRELNDIYKSLHESCIRRKIRRAERENLVYEKGRSKDLQAKFRTLLLLTRRRHKLPPQPLSWIHNMVESLGDLLTIHVLSKAEQPVASILTLQFKNSLIYKYGCSDSHFGKFGAMPLLFWKAIQQAKVDNIEELDLGRSSYNDIGLIAFKEHLGSRSIELAYYRNLASEKKKTSRLQNAASTLAGQALVYLPDSLFSQVGKMLYRHIG